MKRAGGLLLVLASGCDVEPIDINEKACDDEHPCVQGYVCVDDVCVREDAPDAGPEAASED